MKRWIKLLITIALAVSIPLQGLAAVNMPTCKMSTNSINKSVVKTSSYSNIGVDKSVLNSSNCVMNVKNCCTPISSKTCSDHKCSICHISLFQLPDTGLLFIPDTLTSDYQDLISEPYQTFPAALFHPPKKFTI